MLASTRTASLVSRLALAAAAVLLTCGALETSVRAYRSVDPVADPGSPPELTRSDRVEFFDSLSDGPPITSATFNVYYFGGSTMASRHWIRLIGRTAGGRIDGRPIRWFRVAADAKDLHYNAVRLRALLEQRDRFHPDLCR
jgi:hypothetical protein